jgi:hypothetical protein
MFEYLGPILDLTRNLGARHETTKTKLPKKADGAQSSIEKMSISPKDINS